MHSKNSKMTEVETLELVEELALNHSHAIDSVQIRSSQAINAELTIRSGNASARDGSQLSARSVEISKKHVQITSKEPLRVGDIYLVAFEQEVLAIPNSYVICSSCALHGEQQYVAELGFFVPVELSAS